MKKIALSVATIGLVASLSGCSSAPSYQIEKFWVKDGVSQEEAKKQFFDCKEKAKTAAERETQIGGLTEHCMQLDGYQWGEYRTKITK